MSFASDTEAPAHPSVLQAIANANEGRAASYGADALSTTLQDRLSALFETEVSVLLTASGTAANALALSVLCPPTGAILCHEEAHIERDERGAPEFFTGGGKLRLLPGVAGKIDADALAAELAARDPSFVHETPAAVLSLTNLNENGVAYTPEEMTARTAPARESGLRVHVDGARLSNALAYLGCKPADLTWRAGADTTCFGLTKNGALGCEAIILFGDARTRFEELQARAKRAGHLAPKIRYLAAQMLALLADDLWLRLAHDANGAAQTLARLLTENSPSRLALPVHGNEVFVTLPANLADHLQVAGIGFYPWPGGLYRFVCSWSTTVGDLDRLRDALADWRGAKAAAQLMDQPD